MKKLPRFNCNLGKGKFETWSHWWSLQGKMDFAGSAKGTLWRLPGWDSGQWEDERSQHFNGLRLNFQAIISTPMSNESKSSVTRRQIKREKDVLQWDLETGIRLPLWLLGRSFCFFLLNRYNSYCYSYKYTKPTWVL